MRSGREGVAVLLSGFWPCWGEGADLGKLKFTERSCCWKPCVIAHLPLPFRSPLFDPSDKMPEAGAGGDGAAAHVCVNGARAQARTAAGSGAARAG